jgi:hypothetical protein
LLDHDHGNGCMLSTSQRTKGLERSSTLWTVKQSLPPLVIR